MLLRVEYGHAIEHGLRRRAQMEMRNHRAVLVLRVLDERDQLAAQELILVLLDARVTARSFARSQRELAARTIAFERALDVHHDLIVGTVLEVSVGPQRAHGPERDRVA